MRLQILITGREVVVQEVFQKPDQILHMLPYFISEEDRNKQSGEIYIDDREMLNTDQRDIWWQKYALATNQVYGALPGILKRSNLIEITAQPLLNYLVALSFVQGQLTLSEETSLNTIYADLLNAVYERGYENNRRHIAIGDMSKKQFVRILEEIALSAWHDGDGRITTVREIEEHCENNGLRRLLAVFEEGAKAGITRLLAAFYFRQSGIRSDEKTFEFTHKSFGEYLTACRIVRAMERIQKQLDRRKDDMEEGWDERKALLYWANACGPTRMDVYLLNFLRAEVALKDKSWVARWQITFSHLIGVMLRQGMPMERVEPALKFQAMNQWAINSEEALLAALSCCALVTKDISKIDWPTTEACGAWLNRMQGQRTGEENVVVSMSLGYLDLSYSTLFFCDLYRANLNGVNLSEASLDQAFFYHANLSGASLEGASLYRARLDEANLDGASLVRTRFTQASFDRASLEGANLSGASLEGANLREANLEGANLREANLREANLEGANLKGANLDNTQWSPSTSWANISGLDGARNVPEELKEETFRSTEAVE